MTGHLVAIKLTKYAWHMVAAGFFAVFFSKDQATKQKAEIAHGLGLLFVGMEAMGKLSELNKLTSTPTSALYWWVGSWEKGSIVL